MKYIITKDDESISRFSLGCMNLPLDDKDEINDIFRLALEFGVNYFDTADLYQYGRNEAIVGPVLRDYRKHFDIKIGTKVGNEFDTALREKIRWNPSSTYIKSVVENSKNRLGVPVIDLYQLHGGTMEDNKEDTIKAFEELKENKVIKSYGLSSIRKNVIDYYKEHSNMATLMTELSIVNNQGEEFMDETFRDKEIVLLARGGLMQGLLTENYEDVLASKFKRGNRYYTYQELKEVIKMLTDYNYPLESIAFKYLDQKNAIIVNGVSSRKQLESNVQHYIDSQYIPEETIKEIRENLRTLTYKEHRE